MYVAVQHCVNRLISELLQWQWPVFIEAYIVNQHADATILVDQSAHLFQFLGYEWM